MTTPTPQATPDNTYCLVCRQTSDDVPLLTLAYKDGTFHICPQHLPILIHQPGQLANILPGAEHFEEAAHHD